jgi:hypothetical protein
MPAKKCRNFVALLKKSPQKTATIADKMARG